MYVYITMNVYIFLILNSIFTGIICAYEYPVKNFEEWQNFVHDVGHGKNEKCDERLSKHVDDIGNNRRKRSVNTTESPPGQQCPTGRKRYGYEETAKCPIRFCQHVSYRCDIRCTRQETGDNCGLHNCAGTHHCPYSHTIPLQEVCDDKSQCPDSDDESVCVHPCQPSCMCVGLIVNFSDPSLGTVRAPSYIAWNDSISPGFLHLSNIGYLAITNINELYKTFLNGLQSLRSLDLSNNGIVSLPESLFDDLSSLVSLHLSYNKLNQLPTSVFYGLSGLRVLLLDNNIISVLADTAFRGLPVLESLDLYNNRISVLPDNIFNELPRLKFLGLSNNRIMSLNDDSLRSILNVTMLILSGNFLTSLPTLPASVQYLDISYNDFSSLTFSTFTNHSNLIHLIIIGNKLKVKQHMFEGLDNLIFLVSDTPFMCCVKPKSVAEDSCINRYRISSCDNLIGSDLLRVFLWIIGVCALIGNFAVMFYRLYIDRDNIRRSYSIFVLNLSVSDFLMGIYLLIIGTVDVNYRNTYAWNDQDWRKSIICTIAGILSNVSSEMSTFLILMVTIDRVIVIVSPMSRLSRRNISWKQACLFSFFLWCVAITIAIIPAISLQFYFKDEYYSQSGLCLALPLTGDEQPGSEYSFAVFVCLNSFVFVIIAIGQLCMFKSLVTSGGSRVASSRTRQRDLSVARTLFLVVATDFCCWFPIGVMGVMSKIGFEISNDVYAWVMVFVLPVNAAFNPFLYTVSAIWRRRQRAR